MQHGSAAIDQQQGIALAQAAQGYGGNVATGGVRVAAAQHLLVERHAAQLRDGTKEIGA